ncbi:MAG: transketolase, partial [Promethearchaeota archaeon]
GSIPGIEISTGSLGIGASASVGFALAAKLDNLNRRVYTLLGDGECEEGLVWEAAMSAAHFNLDNLIFIIDRNSIQLDDTTENIMSIEPFSAKWDAFGWNIIEIDGNSISELIRAIKTAQELKGKPTAIIAYKIKGEGISFMEFIKEFHGKPPNKEEYENAIKELEKELENLKKNNMKI